MNCMLQALFHNSAFRAGLYAFSSANKESESPVIHQLQLLFGFLELGVKAYYDPTPFTTEIGLAPQVQQDVQEFFKALSTYLEEQFSGSPSPKLQTLVQDLFSGKMAYVTQCKACKTESKTTSAFYELDMHIDGVATIEKSIENYIRPEELTGSNQYHCGNCDTKRDAARFIEITSQLPQVLNFQLMRFVFDWETETKKKVKTAIEFPEFLDMNKFVRVPEGAAADPAKDTEEESGSKRAKAKKMAPKKGGKASNPDLHYRLSYVLVHRGQSAYGGHYIAFVRDEATDAWWKFNDEAAEPVTDLAKALASNVDIAPGVIKTTKKAEKAAAEAEAFEEEESAPTKPTKKSSAKKAASQDAKAAPGNERWKSSSAYMLGYTRIGTNCTKSTVPAEITSVVEQQNESFHSVVDRQKAVLKTIEMSIRERKAQREKLMKAGLCARPDDPTFEVLPTEDNGSNDMDTAQAAVTRQLETCQWISSEWYTKWLRGGNTNLDDDAPAEPSNEALSVAHPDSQMAVDPTTSTDAKSDPDVEIMQIENPSASSAPADDGVLIVAPPSKPLPKANFGLLCEHGRMDPLKVSVAKRISTKAWKVLTSFVSFGPSLDKNSFCIECSYNIIRYGANKNEDDKNKSDILSAIKPDASKNGDSVEPTYWISKIWLASYSKKTTKQADLDPTINSTLQCPHGLLSPDSRIRRRIPATQWVALKSTFPAALEFPSVLTTGPMPKSPKAAGAKEPVSKATAKKGAKASSQRSVDSFFVKKAGSQASHTSSSGSSSSNAIELDDDDLPSKSQQLSEPSQNGASKSQHGENNGKSAKSSQMDVDGSAERTSVAIANALSIMDADDSVLELLDSKGPSTKEESQISATSLDQRGIDEIEKSSFVEPPVDDSDFQISRVADDKAAESESEEFEEDAPLQAAEPELVEDFVNHHPSAQNGRASVRLASIASAPRPRAKPVAAAKPKPVKLPINEDHINRHTEEEAEELDVCHTCLRDMQEDSEVRDALTKRKVNERRRFTQFLASIPSSIQSRISYSYTAKPTKSGEYYLVDLPWAIEWRMFLKEAAVMKLPERIPNSNLLCEHGRLMFEPSLFFNDTEKNTSFAIASAEVWEGLKKLYKADRSVSFSMSASGVCDGYTCCYDCMDKHNTDREIQAAIFQSADLYLTVEDCRTNKRKRPPGGLAETSRSRGSKKHFISGVSYLDTVGMLKMKIFEKYDVPPAEMVLINNHGRNMPSPNPESKMDDSEAVEVVEKNDSVPSPIFLEDEDKTLEFYGVRSDRAFTVRLVDPTDRDVYKASDERNAGFGATVLMGKRTNAAVTTSTTDKEADTSLFEEEKPEVDDGAVAEESKAILPDGSNGSNGAHTDSDGINAALDDDMDEETRKLIEKLTQEDKDAENAAKSASQRSRASAAASAPPTPSKAIKKPIEEDGERGGSKSAPLVLRDASALDVGSWKCSNCSADNSCLFIACELCGHPTSAKTWNCANCKIGLHLSTPVCPQCHTSRVKQVGLFDYADSDSDVDVGALDDDDEYDGAKPAKRRKAKATARSKRIEIDLDDETSGRQKRRAITPAEKLDGGASSKRSKNV